MNGRHGASCTKEVSVLPAAGRLADPDLSAPTLSPSTSRLRRLLYRLVEWSEHLGLGSGHYAVWTDAPPPLVVTWPVNRAKLVCELHSSVSAEPHDVA
jgi:hypothetical protein